MTEHYIVRLAGPVVRAIQDELPEAVAAAMIEFFNGALRENPHRVGRPLRRDLEGLWSARRGSFRAIYSIDDHARIVAVLRVDHRRDVYR
ncbi:MAG: type II toxin-antitoxin system RelE/ParE family toxin [Acidobacteriota bacterium]